MSDLQSDFEEASDNLRGHLFTARMILAILVCPLIGLILLMDAISQKGLRRLTFGDLWPAVSISLAGVLFVVLYRFVTMPIKTNASAPDGKATDATERQASGPPTMAG